jgi:hypothetical protein
MWTIENRGRYDRSRLRYPSDPTDEEWTFVEPLIADLLDDFEAMQFSLRHGDQTGHDDSKPSWS